MSPIEVLKSHFVGKRIVSSKDILPKYIGGKIVSVRIDSYDSVFTFYIELSDGKMTYFNALEDWNIEVA